MKVKYLADQLTLYTETEAPYVFLVIGVLIFLAGIVFYRKTPQGFKTFAPIVGFLLAGVSVTALMFEQSTEIIFSKTHEHVRIIEKKGFEGQFVTTFPYDNFTHIEVLKRLSFTKKPDPKEEMELTLQLMRPNSMPIKLGYYSDLEQLHDIILHLRKQVPFLTYIIVSPDYLDADFFKQFVNEENIEVKYQYPIYPEDIDPTPPTSPIFSATEGINLHEATTESRRDLYWYNRKSVFWITIIDIIVASLLILMYRIIVTYHRFTRWGVSIYVLLVIAGIICGAITLATFAGQSHIRFDGRNLVYSTKLLGITAYENRVTKPDIQHTSNAFTDTWETNLRVLKASGLTLLYRMQLESANTPDLVKEFENALLSPKEYVMRIDTSPLAIYERMLLEEAINDFKESQ
ncbi:MAG: hypothetical protein AAF740_05200 [Bacteroidota bacterium]